MLRLVIVFSALCVFLTSGYNVVNPGPKYPPTKGEVWPEPKEQTKEDTYYEFTPNTFKITENGQTCDTVKTAIERYTNVLKSLHLIASTNSRKLWKDVNETSPNTDPNFKGTLEELQINLSAPCESYPYLDMDEKYSLKISAVSTLNSGSMWGVLRGLETFVQLFYISNDYKNVFVNTTQIEDSPKYTHRGLLVDTSGHFLSVATILEILDGMEMNKMNVFHWHIGDDESFPYQSEKLPHLYKAAYDATMVYTAANINEIVNYARDRGIRILPEFNIPGHMRSFSLAYPNIVTRCVNRLGKDVGIGAMDPTNNNTYELLGDLFSEVQERFPDKYIHIGGDRVRMDCWKSNPEIDKFMDDHNMKLPSELLSLFVTRVLSLLGEKSKPIVMQDFYHYDVSLPNGTVIEVSTRMIDLTMKHILAAGHKVIATPAWFLDRQKDGGDWERFYSYDPRNEVSVRHPDVNVDNILGAEASIFSEIVDDTNIVSRIWPRASAVAEVLWSGGKSDLHMNFYGRSTHSRLEEHACRMKRRGVRAQPPNGPGFCVTGN